jgi:hypothetical protein
MKTFGRYGKKMREKCQAWRKKVMRELVAELAPYHSWEEKIAALVLLELELVDKPAVIYRGRVEKVKIMGPIMEGNIL